MDLLATTVPQPPSVAREAVEVSKTPCRSPQWESTVAVGTLDSKDGFLLPEEPKTLSRNTALEYFPREAEHNAYLASLQADKRGEG